MFATGYLIRGISWLLIAIMLTGMIGQHIRRRNRPDNTGDGVRGSRPVITRIDWSQVNGDLSEAVIESRNTAQEHADKTLRHWTENLSNRIDEHFLPWYFSYWTQKGIGFRAMQYWVAERDWVERFIGAQPSTAERITEDVQTEFANRVLRPAIAQREIASMTRQMIEIYFVELHGHLNDIQARYEIPQPEWNAYLSDMALLSANNGPDTTPLTLKTLYTAMGASGIIGTVVLWDAIRHTAQNVGTKVVTHHAASGAGKAAAATAAKAGAATSAKLGTKLLGPIVLIGVVTWDVLDHNRSRNIDEPILRENLNDYLSLLHDMLLNDAESGMMGVILRIETSISESLQKRSTNHISTNAGNPYRRNV